MSRPNVTIKLTNGNLGRQISSKDGVAALIGSGIAVEGHFALGDIIGPIYKPEDAEQLGIDAQYDKANKVLLYHHIVDFYKTAGTGTPLYLMVVANTVTLSEMANKNSEYAAKLIERLNGELRIVMLSRVPNSEYRVNNENGIDDDALTALIKAQELWAFSFENFRPVTFLIEGRAFSGNVSHLKNLRDEKDGPKANRVGVVISADADVSNEAAEYSDYANVAFVGGRLAAIPVQRNIGRVRDGALPITNAGLSGNIDMSQILEADLDVIDAKGYIFMWKHPGKAGWYFNMDHAACPIDDDYAYLSRGRTIDKAARLLRQVYLENLLDELELDNDGKLEVSVVKAFQASGKSIIETNMLANKEASAVTVFVDSDQNVLATDKLAVQLRIVPVGIAKEIVVNLGFSNSANT